MKVGSAWTKKSEKTGKQFISTSLMDEALPLTITEDKILTFWHIPKEDRKSENSPHWDIVLSKKKEISSEDAQPPEDEALT